MTAPLTVLQVTDTHLKAALPSSPAPTLLGVDTADSLAAVLAQALAEHTPDAVIASGDLAHDAEAATYERFRGVLRGAFDGPVLHLPGNHDRGEPFRRVLGERDELRLGDWVLIAFDTHRDDQTEAAFGDAERAALEARIDASDAAHVLLACHHHLLPVDCPWLDKDRVPAGRELLASLAQHPRVRALVFGHVHQEVSTRVDGLHVLGTPSTCFQFEPRSERFAIDRSPDTGRPGYRWITLEPDGAVSSRVGRLDGYPLNIDLSDRS